MKKNVQKVVAGTLASSFLFQSCVQGYMINDDIVSINEKIKDNADLIDTRSGNNVAIPIDLKFSAQSQKYIDFLGTLTVNIINNPQIAQQFYASPQAYLRKNGITGVNINLDECMLKVILALGDKDINRAIMESDLDEFFNICCEKGLIDMVDKSSMAQIQKMLAENPDLTAQNLLWSAVAAFFAAVVGVAVFVWAVAITHVGGANVALLATVFKQLVSYNTVTKGGTTIQNPDTAIRVWTLKNGVNGVYVIRDKATTLQVEKLVSAVQAQYPGKITSTDAQFVKNSILLNTPTQGYEKDNNQ